MNRDRLIALSDRGLRSEGLGPDPEWAPCSPVVFQRIHARYWGIVAVMIDGETGGYEDLPDWMTEIATEQLELN